MALRKLSSSCYLKHIGILKNVDFKIFQIRSLHSNNNLFKCKIIPFNEEVNYIEKCWRTSIYRTYTTQDKTPKDNKIPISPLSSLLQQKLPNTTQKLSEENHEKDEEQKRKDREQAWKTMKYTLATFGIIFASLGGWLIVEYGAPRVDENGEIIRDEFSDMSIVPQYCYRMLQQLDYFQRMIKEPSREKLLPDIPETAPYFYPKYTLVLELNDVLVHPDWTYQTGWRFKKRPGVDHFLQELSPPMYEIVVFTAETGMTVVPIIEALDPNKLITYKLVRDSTHFVDGHHIKNLDKLNRNLNKVIVVDWNSESVKFHPDNLLKLPRWTGNDDDTTLIDLAEFLKIIAATQVEDVREILTYYSQFDNPLAVFRENQRLILEQQEQLKEIEASQPKPLTKSWTPNFLKR